MTLTIQSVPRPRSRDQRSSRRLGRFSLPVADREVSDLVANFDPDMADEVSIVARVQLAAAIVGQAEPESRQWLLSLDDPSNGATITAR